MGMTKRDKKFSTHKKNKNKKNKEKQHSHCTFDQI